MCVCVCVCVCVCGLANDLLMAIPRPVPGGHISVKYSTHTHICMYMCL